ncbi:DUF3987 domain-containing protein [Bacteroides thetaiotaomicron]|uniref:DUF3987 domain-containing protein n=1 Tax=Bacteroides thetaiotaomicron TaxID=818 RepID=UPI00232E6B93|nr:DUF3987 domain-containing protein [Bacteroides thetaiotaomicron]MDC2259855.1 DUF3987 domain-containing protein [Bacteroides thetaiotaomicron]MDC2264483.1 DUF3987 domain-containing protein [Bacteroides thetaiotaomicron]
MTNIESLRLITEAVETAGADIAPSYTEYVQLAFAIATDCGEAGREFFHRLCRISAKYQREHAERMFSNALIKQHGEIHLGTAFHLAESTGVKICREEVMNSRKNAANALNAPYNFPTHRRAYNKVEEEEEENDNDENANASEELSTDSDPLQPLPTFPEADWPKILMLILSYATSPTQRDILLLGALTALGATMERYVRCSYSGKYQSPCLQTFFVAPPASGKSGLSLIRLLVEPIHDKIRQQVDEEMKAYRKEKKNYELLGKERVNTEAPQMPPNKMFLISGNNSGTGILQNIMDANGTGLICETEADTIASAISSEYGHWSDTLRKAFDHDRLSYNRRTDQEYREVKRIFLAVLLSGTPAQVRALIPSAENGLFSRQLFYYMHGIYTWTDQFACGEIDLDEIFRSIGRDWQLKLDILKEHGIHTLRLTDEQKKEFNALFSDLFFRSDIANGNEMRSFIARLAVNICRIMSTIAMLRVLEIPQPYQLKSSDRYAPVPDKEIPTDNVKDGIITRWDITITPEDFKAVLGLVKPLYRHATHILSFLPSSEIPHRANADRDAFFDALGDEFTRTQLTEQATAMGIKTNTALSWLRRLVKKGLFAMKEKGTYVRARVCVC